MNKPRRDITLGEMHDACNRAKWLCTECDMKFVCPTNLHEAPQALDLTDPPRFNEAQMAFFRWWNERGAVKAVEKKDFKYGSVVVFEDANEQQIGSVQEISILAAVKENGNSLDIAELLGKETNEK